MSCGQGVITKRVRCITLLVISLYNRMSSYPEINVYTIILKMKYSTSITIFLITILFYGLMLCRPSGPREIFAKILQWMKVIDTILGVSCIGLCLSNNDPL